jgi:hypothetical protein
MYNAIYGIPSARESGKKIGELYIADEFPKELP